MGVVVCGIFGVLVQGVWYIAATNAQNLFSLFGLQAGRCATTNFQTVGQLPRQELRQSVPLP